MNAKERQALREKHSIDWYALASRMTICLGCCMDFPCDVIKVLDATENLKSSDLETEVECEHYGVDSGGTDYYGTSNPPQESDWNYTYCPKCGEKL